MNVLFPFGFPFATGFYLTLYVLTLSIHVVFMNYVLYGTCWIAGSFVSEFLSKKKEQTTSSARAVLIDWMPFYLSGAITAGIGPLLFLQILYKERFYSANLLLHYKWIAILPIIIIGFYTLYLLKAQKFTGRSQNVLLSVIAASCFAFVAFSWTENHLLSMNKDAWPSFYLSSSPLYFEPHLLPRLALWAFGSIPTAVLLVSWQLFRREPSSSTIRSAALSALGGIVVSIVAGLWYFSTQTVLFESKEFSSLALPYLQLSVLGLFLQIVSWVRIFREASLSRKWLLMATVGLGFTIIGMTVVREAFRLIKVDITAFSAEHHQLLFQGGSVVFLLSALIGAGVILWALRLVRKVAL